MASRPGFSGTAVSRAAASLIEAAPQTASYDFVLDVRASETGATMDDFQIVLDAYRMAVREPGLKYGCYVSEDPHYEVWARAMGELFGDRTCLVFLTPGAAHAFLDAARAPAALAAG